MKLQQEENQIKIRMLTNSKTKSKFSYNSPKSKQYV